MIHFFSYSYEIKLAIFLSCIYVTSVVLNVCLVTLVVNLHFIIIWGNYINCLFVELTKLVACLYRAYTDTEECHCDLQSPGSATRFSLKSAYL
jgi:hypothetical protein